MNCSVTQPLTQTVSCPCGSLLTPTEEFSTPTRRYVRCPACSLVFRNPQPVGSVVEEFYREDYDGTYGAVESGAGRLPVYRGVLGHLSAYRKPPGRLLDIGCGDGAFLSLCQAAGWTCFGVEVSRRAAERAAQRGITMLAPRWVHQPVGSSMRDESYDVVTLVNVLETMLDPVAVLRRVRRAMTPGGLLLVRVSNGAFHLSMRKPVGWIGARYQQAFHLFVYKPQAMRRMVQAAGFQVVDVRNSISSWGPLTSARPSLAKLGWRVGGVALWLVAQAAYRLTNRQAVWAPSFEMIAEPASEQP